MRPLPQGAPRRGAVRGAGDRALARRVSMDSAIGRWRAGHGARRTLWKPADGRTCARFHRVRRDAARCAGRATGHWRDGSRWTRPPGGGAPAVVRGAPCGSRRMVERAPASTGCAATWRGARGGRPGIGATGLDGIDHRSVGHGGQRGAIEIPGVVLVTVLGMVRLFRSRRRVDAE